MPLFINEIAVKELSALTGVDAEKLKSDLFVDATEAPTETKIKELFADKVVFKKADHTALIDNTGKSKFDEGKYKETNQIVKLALGEKAFDSAGMKREEVFEKIQSELKTKWEAESGKLPDEKVKELTKEKSVLQLLIGDKDKEIETLKGEFAKKEVHGQKERKVLAAVSSVPFTATGEILSKQREVVLKNIISSYDLKVEDGQDVYYKDGKKLVDTYLNPISLDKIVESESIIFPITEASNGRGDDSSKNKSGSIDAELAKCTSLTEVGQLLTKRNLSAVNQEGQAVIRKWTELQAKAKK